MKMGQEMVGERVKRGRDREITTADGKYRTFRKLLPEVSSVQRGLYITTMVTMETSSTLGPS